MSESMARILCAVLSTVRRPPIAALLPRALLAVALLPLALLTACAGDEGPRQMHIATRLEDQAIKVEVSEIPTGREITGLVLIDGAGGETPARDRELITREESSGGNVGPGVGVGATGGSSSGVRPFISLGYLFSGDREVRRSRRMTAEIPLADPAAYAAGWRDWQVALRYRDPLGETQQVSVPAPAP